MRGIAVSASENHNAPLLNIKFQLVTLFLTYYYLSLTDVTVVRKYIYRSESICITFLITLLYVIKEKHYTRRTPKLFNTYALF